MIVAYEVLQDEFGVYRLRVYEEMRFLFWTWTTRRWYGSDGCPGEGEVSRLAKISLGEDELRITRMKRQNGTMTVVHAAHIEPTKKGES